MKLIRIYRVRKENRNLTFGIKGNYDLMPRRPNDQINWYRSIIETFKVWWNRRKLNQEVKEANKKGIVLVGERYWNVPRRHPPVKVPWQDVWPTLRHDDPEGDWSRVQKELLRDKDGNVVISHHE